MSIKPAIAALILGIILFIVRNFFGAFLPESWLEPMIWGSSVSLCTALVLGSGSIGSHTSSVICAASVLSFGGFVSIFPELCRIGAWLGRYPQAGNVLFRWTGEALLAMIGVCMGMFVGSLALAIAEMLDGITIFTRRISFRHGIGIVVLAISLGKLCGSLFFFGTELHRAVAP